MSLSISPSPILIVEDEAAQRMLFSLMLRDLTFPLLAVADGYRAWAILREQSPSLIVLDLLMPEMGGLELLRRIRADDRLRHTKILVVTALVSRHTAEAAALADQVLTKPVTKGQLQQAVRALLGDTC